MTDAEFEARVRELEERSAAHPKRFMARVVALAVLGYGYVVGVLLVTAGLLLACGAVIWKGNFNWGIVKITIALGAFLGLTWNALKVRIDPPSGREVTPAEAPGLYAAIDRLKQKMTVPKLRAILLNDDYNAGVVQHPRLGILGGYQNYLIVGLPLMAALSPRQFDAVLAHEFGHLTGSHGKLGAWLYRIRGAWSALETAIAAKKSWGGFVFRGFMRAFFPTFNAHTFVLARAQEYDADRASAHAVSPREAADALTAIRLRGDFLARFWPGIYRAADDEPKPAGAPHARLLAELPEGPGEKEGKASLDGALRETTGVADTHPSLRDRLASLGEEPRIPPAFPVSAAVEYLGPFASTFAAELDRLWSLRVVEAWRKRFGEAETQRGRLATLEAQAATGTLSAEETWERAWLTEIRRGLDAAAPLYDALATSHANFFPAVFARARLSLSRGEDFGLSLLERAMELEPSALERCCAIAIHYLRSRGRGEETEKFEAAMRERDTLYRQAREERARFRPGGPFAAHGLSEERLAPLRQQLELFPELDAVWLVRQVTQYLPDAPLYVLLARHKPRFLGAGVGETHDKLVEILRLPGEGFIVLENILARGTSERMRSIPGARIWPLAQ